MHECSKRKKTESSLQCLPARTIDWLLHDWELWARDDQLAPEGDWTSWLILGGRGAGKTRAGAEWVRAQALAPGGTADASVPRIALVGETLGDVRSVMIEGVSGLLAVHAAHERPNFEPSKRQLTWPGGAIAQIYSADDPESMRGPQFSHAWLDDEDKLFIYDGTAWVDFLSAVDLAGGDITALGINGAADATNRLSITTPSVLFNRETDDINVTLNKNAVADDARFTFQTGFSTRALFGLLADDDFMIKVTADGSAFNTAIVADKGDGMVSMPQHPKFFATSNFDNYIGVGAWTKVNFNTANHNDQSDFDAGNARFTAPADGFYTFGALVNFKENSTVPTFLAIRLTVGGVAVANTEQRYTGAIVTLQTSLNTHAMLKLNSGDNVEVEVFYATNDGYVEANTCGFWGHKVA